MTFTRALVFSLLAVAAAGCTVPLREARDQAPRSRDPLDARLERCSALGTKNTEDADCQSAFAEARKRILPLPEGK